MRGLLLAGTVIALVPLVLIIYYLFYKGLRVLDAAASSRPIRTAISSATPAGSAQRSSARSRSSRGAA